MDGLTDRRLDIDFPCQLVGWSVMLYSNLLKTCFFTDDFAWEEEVRKMERRGGRSDEEDGPRRRRKEQQRERSEEERASSYVLN